MCDVDGTLITFARDAMPSLKVKKALKKAEKVMHVGVATSRPYYILKHIADDLSLNGPSIINGGAQIMDMKTRKIVWEKPLNHKDVRKACKTLINAGLEPQVLQEDQDIVYKKNLKLIKPLQVWTHGIDVDFAKKVTDKLSNISSIAVITTTSWEKGKVDIIVSHALATKQHGIFEVAKILNIDTKEIIGVGDNYNDFPLLMACGLKVAMGNAVEDLKAIADFVAPSVDEDGVVEVIERFVL